MRVEDGAMKPGFHALYAVQIRRLHDAVAAVMRAQTSKTLEGLIG